jgi:CHAD domain-containing protein
MALRLVRATSEGVGSVSPELSLVDPALAEAVRATPDAIVVGAAGEAADWHGAAGAALPGTTAYDTPDLLLERHGLKLELGSSDGARTWRLTAARGEVVETTSSGPGVPPEIESLLTNVVLGSKLVQVPVRSADPDVRRLEDRLGQQRHALVKYDVGVRIASDPESLHQLRVASRRIRAFLAVGRELVDQEWARELKDGMQALGRASTDARDIDILLEKVRDRIRTFDPRDQEAAETLLRVLEEDRRALQYALIDVLNSALHRRVLDRLALPVVPAPEPPRRKLDQLAARELRRLVARVRRLGKRPGDEQLHDLRIKVKRVRYATELGGAPTDKRARRVVKAATRMQDVLGEHQDAAVGEERLREVAYRYDDTGVAFAAGQFAERERIRRGEIQQRLPAAWKKLRKLAR